MYQIDTSVHTTYFSIFAHDVITTFYSFSFKVTRIIKSLKLNK